MLRIAEAIARGAGALGLVTGESLGQVSSQTLPNLDAIGRATTLPVLRPLLGMDKGEIIERARARLIVRGLPVVPGDRRQLERLFSNLVSNALKHAHPDRPLTVTISAAASPGGWEVAVEDNGVGIPAEARSRIFGLFEQANPADPGSGIGLVLCRVVAEEHGGHIRAENPAVGGARFVVFLPARS
jgi:signal transduction histidine kinase